MSLRVIEVVCVGLVMPLLVLVLVILLSLEGLDLTASNMLVSVQLRL